ncbi:MAG: L,D-transpeptidase [Pseudomonadota bacterium]
MIIKQSLFRTFYRAAFATYFSCNHLVFAAPPPFESFDQPYEIEQAIEEESLNFNEEVSRRLKVPISVQEHYAQRLEDALTDTGIVDLSPQYIAMVDRSPNVQAIFIFIRTPQATWQWVGASPVSTGKPGKFNYFQTPTGVFAHTLKNRDFRAEGTFNENHILGYGYRGMRIFDFGWVVAKRGWYPGGSSKMRLQMHATDPYHLEPLLGKAGSMGCIRIPTTLNVFFDRHGILDADYYQALAKGKKLWMLRKNLDPTTLPGRYLVIIDSATKKRPRWSALSHR